jgi:hypothetical protein
MTLQGGGFAAAVIPAAKHRSKIRGRPSGLKGRRRDRCATGRRPALDPGATTAPHAQRHRAGAGPLPAEPPRRLAAPIKIKSLQTKSPRFQGIATRPSRSKLFTARRTPVRRRSCSMTLG